MSETVGVRAGKPRPGRLRARIEYEGKIRVVEAEDIEDFFRKIGWAIRDMGLLPFLEEAVENWKGEGE